MSDTAEDRTLALLAHLAPLIGYFAGIGQILIPLLILVIKGKSSPFVYEHAKESLNFQICFTIYLIMAGILMWLLVGFLLFPLLCLCGFIFMVSAAIKARNGENYRYPMTIRFIQ